MVTTGTVSRCGLIQQITQATKGDSQHHTNQERPPGLRHTINNNAPRVFAVDEPLEAEHDLATVLAVWGLVQNLRG